MKSGQLNSRIHSKIQSALLERREAERVPMHVRVTYMHASETFTNTAEGFIRDLSPIGCGIRGRISPVVGSKISLTLCLPDREPPLCIVDARVAWVAGDFFGVKFPKLTTADHHRVWRHMWNALYK